MPSFLRLYQPGGSYFFTVVTYDRRPLFRGPRARHILGSVMRAVAREKPFATVAIVLLWDHLHCVWSLPPGDQDFSARWKMIKSCFTEDWTKAGGVESEVTASQHRRGQRGVWQPRFWEHLIRDEEDLERHCDYIHYNPVKHAYAERPWDWPYSSFRRFVRDGDYSPEWGRSEPPNLEGCSWE